MATGAPNPAQPSMKAPKQKATRRSCRRRCDGRDGLLHDFKLAGFDGDIVEKHRGDDDPDNLQQPKACAVEKAACSEASRHPENGNGDNHGRGRTGDGAQVGAHLEPGEQTQQNDDRQGRNKSGKPPVAERVVDLRPGHGVLQVNRPKRRRVWVFPTGAKTGEPRQARPHPRTRLLLASNTSLFAACQEE